MLRIFRGSIVGIVAILIVAGGIWGWRHWQRRHQSESAQSAAPLPASSAQVQTVRLSPQAQKNLALTSAPVKPETYWSTIELPGVVVDRPGISDRGVVSQVTGIVTEIHAHPGDMVAPQQALVTIRLASESLQASQLELFKATRDIQIAEDQKKRIADVVQSGALSQSRIIEIDNQILRLQGIVDAYRQDLKARGLPPAGIDAAAQGEFVTEIVVRAPGEEPPTPPDVELTSNVEPARLSFQFELQELRVQLGEQVQAGEVVCHLADHRSLLVEGRAFADDLPLIQRAAKAGWGVQVEFDQSQHFDWPPAPRELRIHHVANSIDPESRTIGFYLLLENQWQSYQFEGETRLLWRFRPGDRLRLLVAVDQLENVLVAPRDAVVRDGPEAFVFRQNGDLFDRLSVHVLHEDRRHVVLANDGSVRTGSYIAQQAAASLNRVLKAQQSSGLPANLHVHADGTVHAAH